MRKRLLALCTLVFVGACGSSPFNPSGNSNSTGNLHLSVDGATCALLGSSVDVFIDGQRVGTVQPGDRGVTQEVGLGGHSVSAKTTAGDHLWSPKEVTVAAGGFDFLFYCQ